MFLSHRMMTATASSASSSFVIPQSIRFNDDDSAYMYRTPSVAGNRKTWTWSGWVKRGNLGSWQDLFRSQDSGGGQLSDIRFTNGDAIELTSQTPSDTGWLKTTRLFRDTGAWYHFVFVWDTTNATAGNRIRLWVNGVEETDFATDTNPALNFDGLFNNTYEHKIGTYASASQQLDGYLSEIHFIDGAALTASSFGETDTNGNWVPIEFDSTSVGGYGTNGFYITGANSAALGTDYSGNSNTFTTSGLTTADKMLDSPTDDVANGVGNFPTMSPLDGAGTLSNGNMDCYLSSWTVRHYGGRDWPTSGKWYLEVTGVTGTYFNSNFGGSPRKNGRGLMDATSVDEWYCGFRDNDGWLARRYGFASAYGSPGSTNDMNVGVVMGLAFDADNNTIWQSRNGVWLEYNSTGASSATVLAQCEAGTFENVPWISTLIGAPDMAIVQGQSSAESTTYNWNFGQGGQTGLTFNAASGGTFKYTPPAGFKALATHNLPAPTIKDPSAYFQTTLYIGNGTSQSITGVGFQPDFTWGKDRDAVINHTLVDSVRGAPLDLFSSSTSQESNDTNGLTSFDSDGFSLGSSTNHNVSGHNYVTWNWKANGTGASDSTGTITVTRSTDATSGFSIVTGTGTGGSGSNFGHGLSTVDFGIVKNRTSAETWYVFDKTLRTGLNEKVLYLDTTAAGTVSSAIFGEPTASQFYLDGAGVNTGTDNWVAYLWESIAGYSAFGSYTGNGSADGPFVYCGFRPAFILIKKTSAAGTSWYVVDGKRLGYNESNNVLWADSAGVEDATDKFDILSNGFKPRSAWTPVNASATYVYAAFAEHPFGGSGVSQARAR